MIHVDASSTWDPTSARPVAHVEIDGAVDAETGGRDVSRLVVLDGLVDEALRRDLLGLLGDSGDGRGDPTGSPVLRESASAIAAGSSSWLGTTAAASARPTSRATSRIRVCDGCWRVSGICTASEPPGRTRASIRRSSPSRSPGAHQCSDAFAKIRS